LLRGRIHLPDCRLHTRPPAARYFQRFVSHPASLAFNYLKLQDCSCCWRVLREDIHVQSHTHPHTGVQCRTAKYSQQHTSWLSTLGWRLKIAFHKFWQLGAVRKAGRGMLALRKDTPNNGQLRRILLARRPLKWPTLNCKFNPYYIWMCQHFRTVNTHIVNFIERIVWVGWFGSVLFVSVVKQSREVGAKSLCAAQRLYFMHRKWEVRLCGLCRPHAKRSSLEQRFLISFICTGGTQKDVPSSRPAPLTGPLGDPSESLHAQPPAQTLTTHLPTHTQKHTYQRVRGLVVISLY